MSTHTAKEMIRLAMDKGFVFPQAKNFITDKNKAYLAQDAAMQTSPNGGVPHVFTTYIDPKVIEILTAPRNSREVFNEVKKGDWTDSHAQFSVVEMTGGTTPYTDFGNGGNSDVNINFPSREQYVFQTSIRIGERERDTSAKALIDLASQKQRAVATTLEMDSNRFNLLGVANKEIYGLLNEPNLPAAIVPQVGGGGTTAWADKTSKEIYQDIIDLHSEQVKNSGGLINAGSDLVLMVSPGTSVQLATASDYNVSVLDMIKNYFTNLTVVILPELTTFGSGDLVYMVAREVSGYATGEFGFSEKMRAGSIVQQVSSWEQKYTSTTYGCILYYSFAVQSMAGV